MKRWRVGVAALAVLALGACNGDGDDRAAAPWPLAITVGEEAVPGPPQDAGPLAGLQWPGGSVPLGRLIHDDGEALWSVGAQGARSLIWEHPEVELVGMAAGPRGERVALAVTLDAATDGELSGVLYVLEQDGQVRVADAVRSPWEVATPVFLRPPAEPGRGPVLHWVRRTAGDPVDPETGRALAYPVVETDDGPVPVGVALRHREAVWALHGYPSVPFFTFTSIDPAAVPTRYEILMNTDTFPRPRPEGTGLSRWSNNERRAATDLDVEPAWLSPDRYAIAVHDESLADPDDQIWLYGRDCEPEGPRVLYRGTELALGRGETPGWLFAGGPDRLLVARTADLEDRPEGDDAAGPPWYALDIRTGELTATPVSWAPGAWDWVAAGATYRPPGDLTGLDCSEFGPGR